MTGVPQAEQSRKLDQSGVRLLLLADGSVGEAITEYVIDTFKDDLALVVTMADNAIAARCRAANVPTLVFGSEAGVADALAGTPVSLGVTAWWPKILRKTLIALPERGFVNTHPSLLPFNRGKHYNFWALVERAPFGVTLHHVEEGIDCGDIVAQSPIAYDWTDTGETLYEKAGAGMIALFRDAYPSLRNGTMTPRKQDLTQGSFHRAAELELASRIDLDAHYTARHMLNLLRARTFAGYPGCWFEDQGQTYEARIEIRRRSA